MYKCLHLSGEENDLREVQWLAHGHTSPVLWKGKLSSILITPEIDKAALCLGLTRTTQDQGLGLGWEGRGLKFQCSNGSTSMDYGNFLLALCSNIQVNQPPSEGKVLHSLTALSQFGSVWVLAKSDNPIGLWIQAESFLTICIGREQKIVNNLFLNSLILK